MTEKESGISQGKSYQLDQRLAYLKRKGELSRTLREILEIEADDAQEEAGIDAAVEDNLLRTPNDLDRIFNPKNPEK